MDNVFLALKTLHIVSVIAWMAGLLYIYRLFVYHALEKEAVVWERFQVMERRLWRAITIPAAWSATLAGLSMIALQPCHFLSQGWFTLKLVLVVGLWGVHLAAGRYRVALQQNPAAYPARTFRVLNEVPTLLMILIVALVVFQPPWWTWSLCH